MNLFLKTKITSQFRKSDILRVYISACGYIFMLKNIFENLGCVIIWFLNVYYSSFSGSYEAERRKDQTSSLVQDYHLLSSNPMSFQIPFNG